MDQILLAGCNSCLGPSQNAPCTVACDGCAAKHKEFVSKERNDLLSPPSGDWPLSIQVQAKKGDKFVACNQDHQT